MTNLEQLKEDNLTEWFHYQAALYVWRTLNIQYSTLKVTISEKKHLYGTVFQIKWLHKEKMYKVQFLITAMDLYHCKLPKTFIIRKFLYSIPRFTNKEVTVKKDWCVTKNNTMWTDFLYEEDAKELAATQQEEDRAGHVWEAREMTTSELGESND